MVNTENIPSIFKQNQKIYEMSQVHEMQINIYDLEGKLLISSKENFFKDTTDYQIDKPILAKLDASSNRRYLMKGETNGEKFQSSYNIL